MKRTILLPILIISFCGLTKAQEKPIASYTKKTYMIPMRDGTHLFTVVLLPSNSDKPLPFLIQRTPYGADISLPKDSLYVDSLPATSYLRPLLRDGYLLVFQDIRGKFKSEGVFEMN